MYKNIPYLPDLLSSKVMKIVTTIEEQVAKGKNVMVYHNKVEMLRMCHRALAMRKHLWVNKDIFKAGLPDDIAEEDAEVAHLQLGRPQIIFEKNYDLSFGILSYL